MTAADERQVLGRVADHAHAERRDVALEGGLVEALHLGLHGEVGVRIEGRGPPEDGRHAVVGVLLARQADAVHLAREAQPLRAAEEVAVQPERLQREPLHGADLGAEAHAARLVLDHGEPVVEPVARPQRLRLVERYGRERARAAQALLHPLELIGVEHVARGEARDLADALGPHALVAHDGELAEAHHGAGTDGHRDVERLAREVGHDALVARLRGGVAHVAPALDGLAGGLADDAGGRGLAGRELLGQLGAGRQRRDLRLAEAVERPGVHADLDALDGLRRLEGRDLGRLAPVDQDAHHGAVVALRVEPTHDPRVVRARRGDQVLGVVEPLVLRAQQERGLLDLPAQVLLAAHAQAHVHALRPGGCEPHPKPQRDRGRAAQRAPRGGEPPQRPRRARRSRPGLASRSIHAARPTPARPGAPPSSRGRRRSRPCGGPCVTPAPWARAKR